MEVLKIVGITVMGLSLTWILKTRDNKFASLISMLTVIIIGMFIVSSITPIIDTLNGIDKNISNSVSILPLLFKVCGICLLTNIVSLICNEAGEKSLSTMLEFAIDVAILLLCIPLFENIYQTIMDVLNDM